MTTKPKRIPKRRALAEAIEGRLTSADRAPAFSERVDNPESIVKLWGAVVTYAEWYSETKEHLVAFLLSVRGNLLAYNLVSIGGLTECIAHPREILRPVIVSGAHGFVLAHNHPSGDATPSGADLRVTRQIIEASRVMQLQFFDHVIVGKAQGKDPGYYSFRDQGQM